MSDVVIKAEHLSKMYRLGSINSGTLFRDLQSWTARKLGKEDPNSKIGAEKYSGDVDHFWALRDLDFEIHQGDRVGIIGRNGAGKSTLLKILSRITTPTEGSVKIRGKVSSLLEVGTGFHGELTGRENIYLNGAILGMKKRQIDKKLDEIIAFSEIEHHIDTPVKRYSSGMYVRLAFAVAAHLDSEILIADEVLAVGDASFQQKALGKMNDLSTGQGRTVLFVSHQMNAVESLCNCGFILSQGRIVHTSNSIKELIDNYHFGNTKGISSEFVNNGQYRHRNFKIDYARLETMDGQLVTMPIKKHEQVRILIEGTVDEPNNLLTVGIALYDENNHYLFYSMHTDGAIEDWPKVIDKKLRITAIIPTENLNEGLYRVEIASSLHYQEWINRPEFSAPVLTFEISGGTELSPYWQDKRPGILVPRLSWRNY